MCTMGRAHDNRIGWKTLGTLRACYHASQFQDSGPYLKGGRTTGVVLMR